MKKLLWRFAFYIVAMALFTLDWQLNGPLHRLLVSQLAKSKQAEHQQESTPTDRITALVYHKPIYQSQVDWHIQYRLWQEGLDQDEDKAQLSAARLNELQIWATWQAIDEELLKIKARHHSKSFPIDEAQLDLRLNDWLTLHQSEEVIEQWRKRSAYKANQGEDFKSQAREWLRDQWRMELYLEGKVQQYLNEQQDTYQELFSEQELAALSAEDKQVYQQAWLMLKRQEAVKLYREQLRERERGNIEVE